MKKSNKNNGITLIALVISIIVMLILVAVTINLAVNGGLFNYAGKAVGDTQNAMKNEQELIDDIINNYIKPNTEKDNEGGNGETTPEAPGEGGENITEEETISTEESYIGYYADVDGDGEVDGVIYADLAFSKSGTWNPSGSGGTYATTGGAWSYSAESNLKEYVVSQESYEGAFGTKPVIKVKANSKEGTDRFYVMALSDINPETRYCWYDAAYGAISDYTNYSYGFGTGKTNTHNMITAWNGIKYGAKDDDSTYKDVWGVIQETVYGENYSKETKTVNDVKWFLPSANEWAAFSSEFNSYVSFKVSITYWSSSLISVGTSYATDYSDGKISSRAINGTSYVRLSATF